MCQIFHAYTGYVDKQNILYFLQTIRLMCKDLGPHNHHSQHHLQKQSMLLYPISA